MSTTRKGTLEKAIAIAALAHEGQVDKSGAAYILHPIRLMMKMKSPEAMMAAVMHDVVEDSQENDAETSWTFDRLREEGFPEEVVAAIDGVTGREGEDYAAFIERAAENPISTEVKLADLEDNMNLLRLGQILSKDLERLEKYHRSWVRLNAMKLNGVD
jgi:(p)ppGpp synthase/HD superfamily hydrolase